jgi:hypothetical protein
MNANFEAERARLQAEFEAHEGEEQQSGLTENLAYRLLRNRDALHDLSHDWASEQNERRADLAEGVRSGAIRTEAGSPGRDSIDPYGAERHGEEPPSIAVRSRWPPGPAYR